MEITELLRQLTKSKEEIYSIICTVDAIDETKRVISAIPNNGDAEIFDVRLQSNVSGSLGFVCIPKAGSEVVVSFLSKSVAYVALFSAVDKILIDTPLIKINGGELGGVPVVGPVVEKLNAIEDDINELKKIFKEDWTPAPNDGGAALKAAATGWATGNLSNTTTDDLENDKFLQ